MNWENSSVMSEFLKLAKNNDLLGLKKTAEPEKNPHQEDSKTIEEKRLPKAEKHIMEIAHPESVYIAEARGDGALVENEIENQKKLIEIVNKMPTGSLVGHYANAITSLTKLANECDEIGHTEAANKLTDAVKILIGTLDNLPLK